jgi:hypothetical protein
MEHAISDAMDVSTHVMGIAKESATETVVVIAASVHVKELVMIHALESVTDIAVKNVKMSVTLIVVRRVKINVMGKLLLMQKDKVHPLITHTILKC